MSAIHPTVEDLRTVAHNLQAEGQNSRAEVVYSAATKIEMLESALGKLLADMELQAFYGFSGELAEFSEIVEKHMSAARAVLPKSKP